MDDETYIKCDFKQLPGPKFYTLIVRGRVSNKFKYKSSDKVCKKPLLWQAMPRHGDGGFRQSAESV